MRYYAKARLIIEEIQPLKNNFQNNFLYLHSAIVPVQIAPILVVLAEKFPNPKFANFSKSMISLKISEKFLQNSHVPYQLMI
jgi:hypothetical protein